MASTVNSGADEEIHRLRDDNEQLRDDLLTLLHPPQDQATDGSIREDFGNLCQSVDFWVDNIIENSSLEKHGVQLGRREQDLLKEVGIDRLSPKDDNAIASLILSVAVQRELQRRIFDRLCPVGITKQQETVIEQVLQGMQSLESGKEQVTRNRWRSEAVRALTVHKDFEGNQKAALRDIAETAMEFFVPQKLDTPICGLARRAFQKHKDTLYDEIFRAAVELHQGLRSSLYQYTVKPPRIDVDINGDQMADRGWKMKDVDRWQDLRRADPSARPICSLYPSIMRESERRGQMQTIVPPVVVVQSQISKTSGQNSRVQSTRPSPSHSLSAETVSKDTTRNRDRRRGPDHQHGDSSRSRDLSRSTEFPNSSSSVGGNGFFKNAVSWMAGAKDPSEALPTPKQKSPGKDEAARIPSGAKEYRTTTYPVDDSGLRSSTGPVTVMKDSDEEIHRLPRSQTSPTSPERYRHERKGWHLSR